MRHPIRPQFVVQCALFTLLVIACLTCATAKADSTPTTLRTCFPAKQWAPAPDSARPCVTLKANAGAMLYTVADASGIVRYRGCINTGLRRIASVKVIALYEDGSYVWQATGQSGAVVTATIGNLED
jgi:hypothetical protein